MKILPILFALLITTCLCCKNTTDQKTDQANTETLETQATETPPPNSIQATYQSATVYAAATDYIFLAEDGTQILIRISKVDDAANPEMPDNLLVMDENSEDPPEANPAMIGKRFYIEQDEDGFYKKVLFREE